jgi:NAD-dependent dihydropyrimidine dehydrogenase PreA subunit
MKRQIIKIDEEKCTGCGLCIPGCPEGALQIIDGKARLISDLFCDGLGACIGHCPEGAILIEEREAEEYDERKVMENVVKQGTNTIKAHLEHLRDHGQTEFLATARAFLTERGIADPTALQASDAGHGHGPGGGCPGSRAFTFAAEGNAPAEAATGAPSQLTHWPVQMHLISPMAPQYKGADVLLAADCVAFSMGDFHGRLLQDKALAIACPKLDSGLDVYLDKLVTLLNVAQPKSFTVATMEVPCCSGLLRLAEAAVAKADYKVQLKHIHVSIRGEVI